MVNRSRPSRTSLFIIVCVALVPFVLAQTSGDDFVGKCFTTILDLNNEMTIENDRIATGGTPESSYTYVLCANTFIDASNSTIIPLLDNTIFTCGDNTIDSNNNRQQNCVIIGGNEQVLLQDSTITGYTIKLITFIGITFSGFQTSDTRQGTSILASASSSTTVKFINVAWQEFTSDFVIRQVLNGGSSPSMIVEIENSIVSDGTAGSIFDNDRGIIRVTNITVTNIKGASLIATANTGTSFLDQSSISVSEMDWITYTTAAGSQTVTNTILHNMTFVEDAFFVEGDQSTLSIQRLTVEQNNAIDRQWNAIVVRDGAIATISQISIQNNSMLRFGIISFNAAATVSDSSIRQNTGVGLLNATSAPVFGITDALIRIDRVSFRENTDFSGEVVALIRSIIEINDSCFISGNSQAVVFAGADSSFIVSQNFVQSYTSIRCPATDGERLFQEAAGSSCFQGGSRCEGQCLLLADQPTCRAVNNTTSLPSAPPTAPPVSTIIPSGPTTAFPVQTPSTLISTVPTNAPNFASFTPVVVDPVLTNLPTGTMPSSIPIVFQSDFPSIQPSVMPTSTRYPSPSPTTTSSPTTTRTPTGLPSDIPSMQPSIKDEASMQPSIKDEPKTTRPTTSPSKDVFESTNIPTAEITKKSSKKKCKMAKDKGSDNGKGGKMMNGKGKTKGRGILMETGKGKGKGKGSSARVLTKIGYAVINGYNDDRVVSDDLFCDDDDDDDDDNDKAVSKKKKKAMKGKGKGKGKYWEDSYYDRGDIRSVNMQL